MQPFGEVVLSPFEVSHSGRDLDVFVRKLKSLPGETRAVMEYNAYYHAAVALALQIESIYDSAVSWRITTKDLSAESLNRQ